MKLPDFYSTPILNSLREMMGAELLTIFNSSNDYHADFEEIKRKLSGEGIDINFNDIEIIDDYTFEYKGQKVLVYIRDQRSIYDGYKYHIANCSTIQGYIRRNALNRYVVTTRTDGKFLVNLIDSDNLIQKKNELVEMKICKNCLNHLDYKGYCNQRPQIKKNIYNDFSLNEFFANYKSTQHISLPTYRDVTAPVQIYSEEFERVSRTLKIAKNWICQQCSKDFSSNTKQLHGHHINGVVSDNSLSNIEILCLQCHQSRHSHKIGRYSMH